jgi:hypothetical protein
MVTGGALRASDMAAGLETAGHTVRTMNRNQDEDGGFSSAEDLYAKARAWGPDRIIAIQLEDAPALAAVGVPLAVDLYAPRVMEASFEGTLRWTSVETLRALAAGDTFLVSNPRQRWLWWGLLAVAGIDVRSDPTLLVPLIAPNGPRRKYPNAPLFVAGGASWPWQDPTPGLNRVLQHLDKRGEGKVVWYGGVPEGADAPWLLPDHPRLQTPGWVDRETFLRALAGATAAIDWMSPNPERQLAFSFRHADYLGCGLPILTHTDSPLGDVLGHAGWASDDIEATLDSVLNDADEVKSRSRAARALAKDQFCSATALAPLLHWVEEGTRQRRVPTDLLEHAQLAAEAARAQQTAVDADDARNRAEIEVTRKRAEVAALVSQIQALTSTVDRLSRAVDEVAGFKRDAITLLGNQSANDRLSRDEAHQEIALLRADIEKKTAEITGMDSLRERLEHDMEHLRKEVQRLQNRGLLRR